VHASDGTNVLTNSGTIGMDSSSYSYIGGVDGDTITNTKTLFGAVDAGDGTNILKNSGLMGTYQGGSGVDTVTNSGTIVGGVLLNGGNDSFTNTGHVNGIVDLGDGNDHFTGGAFGAQVDDNGGQDTYKFGAGDDFYLAYYDASVTPDGADTVDGGGGNNTYYAFNGPDAIQINLDTVQHTSYFAGTTVAKTTAIIDATHGNTDTILNFHTVWGSTKGGVIFGSATADDLHALNGVTELDGEGGNDTLHASSAGGTTYLLGGAGADQLISGGSGATTYFVYTALGDSGVTAATRDVIQGFTHGHDKIDFSTFDADTTLTGQQHFSALITEGPFTGQAGELRVITTGTGERLEADVTGDGHADFSIDFYDPGHSIQLVTGANGDFIF